MHRGKLASSLSTRASLIAHVIVASMLVITADSAAQEGAAQEGQESSPAPGTPAPSAAPPMSAAPTAEVPFRKASRLSLAEQQKQANDYVEKMQRVEARVSKLAKSAREDKDLIKLNCVNDKLLQIKGTMRLADQMLSSLSAAAARADNEAASHEFAKLTIAYQKVTVLGQDAEACVGEEVAYVGQTRVTVDVDPEVDQQGDPTVEPAPPLPTVRPPVASPTR